MIKTKPKQPKSEAAKSTIIMTQHGSIKRIKRKHTRTKKKVKEIRNLHTNWRKDQNKFETGIKPMFRNSVPYCLHFFFNLKSDNAK